MRLALLKTEKLRSKDSNTEPTLWSFPAADGAEASDSVSRAVFALTSGRDGTGERLLLFREANHPRGVLLIPPDICNQISEAGGRRWAGLEGEQPSPEGQVDSGWEESRHTVVKAGWCGGPARALGVGEASASRARGNWGRRYPPRHGSTSRRSLAQSPSVSKAGAARHPRSNTNEEKNYKNDSSRS